jgi:hypothetical protein
MLRGCVLRGCVVSAHPAVILSAAKDLHVLLNGEVQILRCAQDDNLGRCSAPPRETPSASAEP